jgi:hypothetical protein
MGIKKKLTGLADSAKVKMEGLNDALYPHAGAIGGTPGRIGAFGQASPGFASSVAEKMAGTFYSFKAIPDGLSVSNGQEGKPIPRAIANKYALFNYKGFGGGFMDDTSGSYFNAKTDNLVNSPTVNTIIEHFNAKYAHINYSASDFLYGKYWKQIPLNHMITLRRFATPCYDNIYNLQLKNAKTDDVASANAPAGVTAVTYMGETAGNSMNELLKYTYGLKWEKVQSEMESVDTGDGGYTKQPFYSELNSIGKATADTFQGVNAGDKFRKQNFSTADSLGTTYANFVIGPVNVVDETYVRGRGLSFANDMSITFEYSLKSLGKINPKIAMIDVMTNMMTMTYNNGQFWGGGQRFYGAGGYVKSQFGDISLLKNGNFSGYVGSVVNDVENGFKTAFGDGNGGFDVKGGLLDIGKNLLGNLLGSFLKGNVGGPVGTFATKAFISAEPTGDWHVTIGNPMNPIVMMGNMIVDGTTMTLGEGLGQDDFPVEAKFIVDLKHGKPRDKGDMENMFNAGKGKIYASAAGEKDILNLAGLDVAVYGAVQNVGKQGLQPKTGEKKSSQTSTGDAKTGITPKYLNLDEVGSTMKKIGQEEGASGEFVSNMIGMVIDS